MNTTGMRLCSIAVLLVLAAASACAPAPRMARAPEPVPALPPVPRVDGSLRVDVAWPPPGAPWPEADSTFIFGSVGTGRAALSINGLRVPVAPNGAFLAYVPVPEDGRYSLVARAGGRRYRYVFSYHQAAEVAPSAPAPAAGPETVAFPEPLLGTVVGGRDTMATGSDVVYGAPAPAADRRWFFPRGAQLAVTGRHAGLYRVRLTAGTEAWVDTAGVRLEGRAMASAAPVGRVRLQPEGRFVEVHLPAAHAPFLIEPQERAVGITLYGRTASAAGLDLEGGPLIAGATWGRAPAEAARLDLALSEPLWGFKAFYDTTGTLVVRLRRPPPATPGEPLRGVRILIDPGHPPGGAIGPTGFTEAEANLAVSLRLAEKLRAEGAEALLTRTTPAPLVSGTNVAEELWARVDLAVAEEADLLVSVHNNAFPDGVNPFEHHGTETYYFYPFSEPLAQALLREIVAVTGLPDLGAKQRSLALVRPSWMPSVLTESLFMMFPQQEAALREPAFIERLAEAHLRGITAFLQARTAFTGSE